MRRKIIVFIILFFILFSLKSVEEILIDFSNLDGTTFDFSKFSFGEWSVEDKDNMTIDLQPKNWTVSVTPSHFIYEARNKTYSVDTEIKVLGNRKQKVLAARVFIPQRNANTYILLEPPFEIPSYYPSPDLSSDVMGTMFINKGVVRNVGILKKVNVILFGNNFTYQFYVRIKTQRGEIRDLFVGYINFLGWQERGWVNPHYEYEQKVIESTRNKRPYYPFEYPYVKLMGFYISRVQTELTGNFITMVKEVKIEFDEEVLNLESVTGVQKIPNVDTLEEIFGIYKEDLISKAEREIKKINLIMFQQWQEKRKIHKDLNKK